MKKKILNSEEFKALLITAAIIFPLGGLALAGFPNFALFALLSGFLCFLLNFTL